MLHTMVGYDKRYLDQMHPFEFVKEKLQLLQLNGQGRLYSRLLKWGRKIILIGEKQWTQLWIQWDSWGYTAKEQGEGIFG